MIPVLSLFGVEVSSYAVLITIGYCAGLLVILRRRRIYDLSVKPLVLSYIIAGIGSIIGGKAFFVIQGLPLYLKWSASHDANFMSYVLNAGLVYYGGMIGCLTFAWLSARWLSQPSWTMLDTMLPSLPLAQTFGRVGCFLAGCCYGIPASWGVYMSANSPAPANTPLVPVQLMEAAGTFALFCWLERYGNRRRQTGAMLGRYLTGYGTLRFLLEFLRGDSIRGSLGPLSVAQWFSVGAVLLGAMFIAKSEQAEGMRQAVRGFSHESSER